MDGIAGDRRPGRGGVPGWGRWAWWPLIAFAAAALVLRPLELRAVFEPPMLLPSINFLFHIVGPLLAVVMAARAYVRGGGPSVLALGCGTLVFGLGSLAASLMVTRGDVNAAVTTHNVLAALSGAVHLAGAMYLIQGGPSGSGRWTVPLTAGLLCVAAVVGAVAVARADLLPPFITPQGDATAYRSGSITASVALFFLAAIHLGMVRRRGGAVFFGWYALGLALTGVGLAAVGMAPAVGSPLTWTGRLAQSLGQVYILIGVLTAGRGAGGGAGRGVGLAESIVDIHRALRESQERFRTLSEATFEAIAITNGDGVILVANEQYAALHGCSLSEVIGSHHSRFLHPDEHRRVAAIMASGHGCVGEYRGQRMDGSEVLVEGHGRPTQWFGRPARITALRDITASKRAEQSLRASEERYRSLFSNMTEGFALHEIITDAEGQPMDYRFLEINPAFERLTGLKRADLVGHRVREVLPATEAHWIENYGRVALTGEPAHFEDFSAALDRWYEVFAYRPAPRQFAVIFTDITVRRQAEDALRQSRQDLDRAQSVAQIGWWRLDTRRNVLTWSEENHRIFGIPVGTPLSYETFLGLVHPEDRPRVDGRWQAAMRGEPYDIEHRIVVDGQVKWIREKAYLEFGPDGQLLGGFGISQDITARKEAEQAVVAAKEALERASAAKDQFIANLSHELRTPLTPVVAAVSELVADDRLPADAREDLRMVERNVDLEVHLINDLLDVTRITNGKLEVRKETVDLGQVLRDVVGIVAAELARRGQDLVLDMPQGPLWVEADMARLHQVFWNLVKNAIKFSADGGRIEISCQVAAGSCQLPVASCQVLRVSVRDHGAGIEPEALPRLFRPFEQGGRKVQEGFGGLGLGLAIARGIVQLHGGSIRADSDGVGKGATFTVELPVAAGTGELRVASCELRDSQLATRDSQLAGPLRILLVEDHPDTARLMARLLRARGYQVTVADSVQAALLAVRSTNGRFDVVMSDLGLPDGNGYELMRQLTSAGWRLPGIAVSGFGSAADVARSLEAGFSQHVTKPINFAVLHSALLKAVEPRSRQEPAGPA